MAGGVVGAATRVERGVSGRVSRGAPAHELTAVSSSGSASEQIRQLLEPAAGTEKKQRKGRAREGERERELGGGGELRGDKKRDERLTGRGQHPTW